MNTQRENTINVVNSKSADAKFSHNAPGLLPVRGINPKYYPLVVSVGSCNKCW